MNSQRDPGQSLHSQDLSPGQGQQLDRTISRPHSRAPVGQGSTAFLTLNYKGEEGEGGGTPELPSLHRHKNTCYAQGTVPGHNRRGRRAKGLKREPNPEAARQHAQSSS